MLNECECKKFYIACKGTWDETITCKECHTPMPLQDIIDKVAQLEAENKSLHKDKCYLIKAIDWTEQEARNLLTSLENIKATETLSISPTE